MGADPALVLRNGLLREMPPVQALVMMQLYQQFPKRWRKENGMFFLPDEAAIMRTMHLKPPRLYELLGRLVDGGYLEKRLERQGMEYRIRFESLERFRRPPIGPK